MMAGSSNVPVPMVHPSQQKPSYARPRTRATITITRKDRRVSFNFRPWMTGALIGGFAIFSAAYLGATGYLVYRDDLLGDSLARQVGMQHAYESRIAALRSEIDRVASRHAVRTAGVEDQVTMLLERQAVIEGRQSTLDHLVAKAREAGLEIAQAPVRLPKARPVVQQVALETAADVAPLAYLPRQSAADKAITEALIRPSRSVATSELSPDDLRPIVSEVRSSLDAAEAQQHDALDALGVASEVEAEKLSSALAPLGVAPRLPTSAEPQGGPFVPASGMHFVERAAVLEETLEEIAMLRRRAAALPLAAPVRAERLSSGFGYRSDPFLNRKALHPAMDMVAPKGAAVHATAPGKVVSAGWNGGYGYMVEIRHPGGISTRYAHLSAILVEKGAEVAAGTLIGRVGSTGRSTGPHLHYETRRDGKAVNPAPYLAAGRELQELGG